MKDKETTAGRPPDVEAEAIAWFTRMNGKPSRVDHKHFEAWLAARPLNRQTYEDVHALWSSAGAQGADVAREEEQALSRYLDDIRRMREQRARGRVGGVIAVCLCTFLASSWVWLEKPGLFQDIQADYLTARGERRTIMLEDGSTIMMDADTAINVDMAAERSVHLLRGAAFFTVTPSNVPFVVHSGKGEARVLGTKFDIAMQDGSVSVTLESGSLQVTAPDTSKHVVLAPGEGVAYGTAGMGQAEKVDLDERQAWHEGRFVFNNVRLGDVLARIERYRPGRIVVLGNTLAHRRVSGSFSIADTDAALASVQSSVGFTMNEIGGRLVVIRP